MSKAFENFMDEYKQKQTEKFAYPEAMILAQSSQLLSRALAHVGEMDTKCARQLAVEIRDHLDVVKAYAIAKGIGWELSEAHLTLLRASGAVA